MKERELEALIRMAAEIDDLGHAQDHHRQARADLQLSCPSCRDSARPDRRTIQLRRALAWFVPAAAAALLALCLARPQALRAPGGPNRASSTAARSANQPLQVDVCYTRGALRPDSTRIDAVQPTPSEDASLMAILRTWSSECGCLLWRLYEWDDGQRVADASAGEQLNLDVNVAEHPVDQVVVLAFARDAAALPSGDSRAQRLLDCLNSRAAYDGPVDAAATTGVVRGCLPSGVTVVAQAVPRHGP